jgi:predicted phosphodiesterase
MVMAKTKHAVAVELCKRFPGASSRSLGRKLYAENAEWFPNEKQAYNVVLRARGSLGVKVHIADKSAIREKNTQPALPPSDAKAWEPFIIDGPTSLVSLSDIHCPYHNEQALTAAVAHARKLKPDIVLLNGDIGDFYSASHWERDPKKRQLREEVDKLRDCLLWLLGQFPKARIVYKQGNHEERLTKFIWAKAPELWDLPQLTLEGLMKIGNDLQPIPAMERIEWVSDQRPIMAGKLPIFHGHELPKGLASPVNPARGAYLRMADSVLVAHSHRSSAHTEYDWRHEPTVCWSQGCLCDMSPAYARINKWNHGFAAVEVAKDGAYDVRNFQILPCGSVKGA